MRRRPAPKPPFFVVGAPRSGTGLLRNLLRSHPHLSIPLESHFLPDFFRAYGDPEDDAAAVRLASRILAFPLVRRWELSLAPEDFADCRSYRAVAERLYSAWAAREGKPRWGDKTPHYVRHLPLLREIFPSAQFLHIVRDGRAVAASWAAYAFGPGSLYVAARQWRESVLAGRRSGSQLPPGAYLELRYERLLRDPEATLREVYAFLDEPFPADPLRLTPPPGPDRGWSGVSRTRLVPENADAWRERMPVEARRVVEATAGDALAELGYELGGGVEGRPGAPPAWRQLAWRARSAAVHYGRILRSHERRQQHWALYRAAREARRRRGHDGRSGGRRP